MKIHIETNQGTAQQESSISNTCCKFKLGFY